MLRSYDAILAYQQTRRSRRLQQKGPTEKKEKTHAVATSSNTRPTINKLSNPTQDCQPSKSRGILHKYKEAMQDSGHQTVDPKKPIVALLRRSTRLKTLTGASTDFY